MKRISIILIGVMGFVFGASAQNDSLGIGPMGITGISQTVIVNAFDSFAVEIVNKAVLPFYGDISIKVAVQDTDTIIGFDEAYLLNVYLAPGESFVWNSALIYNTEILPFKLGGNTVVIWPEAVGAVTVDSAEAEVSIIEPPSDSLGIDFDMGFYLPDSVDGNTIDSCAFYVQNKGTTVYTGPLEIRCWSQPVDDPNMNYYYSDFTTYDSISLQPGQGQLVTLILDFDTSDYKPGGNTVVIWPVGAGALTVDSLSSTVFVRSLTSINQNKADRSGLFLYPNPTSGKISIGSAFTTSIGQVRILDATGRELSKTLNTKELDLSIYKSGLYIIEIDFNDSEHEVFRILKK